MNPKFINKQTTFALLASGMMVSESNAATLTTGYTVGSTLLTSGGETLFVDAAAVGGGDINNVTGNISAHLWEIPSGGNWVNGDTVEITGIAIPIWATNTTAAQHTANGTFTFTFRSLGINDDYDTGDTATIGTADATFSSEGTGVGLFYVNFDTPVTWVADSQGFGVQVVNTSNIRLKQGPTGAGVEAVNFGNGTTRTGYQMSLSVAGNVISVPEPSSALLAGLGALALLRRRR